MNVEKLRELQNLFRTNPKCLDMDDWHYHLESCGTVGCIAGWTAIIARMKESKVDCKTAAEWVGDARTIAKNELELTELQCEKLFYRGRWPRDLREAYDESSRKGGQARRAEVTCERIDRFIESKGVI